MSLVLEWSEVDPTQVVVYDAYDFEKCNEAYELIKTISANKFYLKVNSSPTINVESASEFAAEQVKNINRAIALAWNATEVKRWLDGNVYDYEWTTGKARRIVIQFKNITDAMLFKLTWH